MKARRLLVAVPFVVIALVVSGCTGGDKPGGDQPTQPTMAARDINAKERTDVHEGGELRQAVAGFGASWNPLHADGVSDDQNKVRWPLGPNLFDYDAKGKATPNPNYVLEATDNGADPLVVTYKLNPKAKWNNGSPIDADDFIATWKACNGTNNGGKDAYDCATTRGFESITEVKAGQDKFEVQMSYKSTYPDWRDTFRTVLPAESVKDAKTFNEGWKSLNNDWFAGPYIYKSYDKASKILIETPNPKWWGEKPLVEQLTFRTVPVADQATTFAGNELDTFSIGVNADAYARAKTVADAEIRSAGSSRFRQLTLNAKSDLLKDKALRQTVVRALDRTALAKSDLAGMDTPVVPLNNHLFKPGQDGYIDNVSKAKLGYDAEKAKADLEAAGWKAGSDGTRSKDGTPLEIGFTRLKGDPASENEAAEVEKMLAKVGIKIKITEIEPSELDKTLAGGDFDMIAHGSSGTDRPLSSLQQNYPDADSLLIEQIDTTMDPKKRLELANQLDQGLWDNAVSVPLYQSPDLVAAKKTLANFGALGLGTVRAESWAYQK